ncbi:hypothetical protein DENSPDRAFT_372846 [Dentipellis sp. KUC8613]|nr:hypothetical protein DENSPDRAFT_372846 [Dentipellis sp. KUC8613]
MAPLRMALASGPSTCARSLYHPSVTSSSGCEISAKPSSFPFASGHNIFDIQRTIGEAAGASCVVIKRRAGRDAPLSSLSYLQSTYTLPHHLAPAPSLFGRRLPLWLEAHHAGEFPQDEAPVVINPCFRS